MPALAVQGVSSWAGKSLLATALVRLFARRGVRVAPFKAQNMSNNARVARGGEIGAAQYLQALAAGLEPDVRMNPVLVKPEGDRRSQVVVAGRVDAELGRRPWRARGPALWPPAEAALRSLLAEFELVVIEGAGSPAELNLRSTDLANMRAARAAGARVVLVADIDRGGAFAHLYGTWALLEPDERAAIGAFVLNKFRGDASLLAPAPAELERLTGVPVAGVLPWLEHGLPDEDGASARPPAGGRPRVAVVRYPTASNLDELRALEEVADVAFAAEPGALDGADLVVLPGSKHVAADLAWLRRTGLAGAVAARARAGGRILGVCGGLQMLGGRIDDPAGVDGAAEGLGLLPVATRFEPEKLVRRREVRLGELAGPWRALSGLRFAGYEIRHGRLAGGDAVARGAVLGVAAHGLFESREAVAALLGRAPRRTLEQVFDELADAAEEHLDVELVAALAGVA
ncbi:MAG TPA: cobyric acid synthase [Gaiellaceae bacterium]|nr:cobyric acid synthase [Gaiellaceae bacterium]